MSVPGIEKTKMYGKTSSAVLLECVLIIGSFVLFSSRFDLNALKGLKTILVISYPFLISFGAGLVAASLAATKHLVAWKWGGLATAITLFLIIILVTLPSFISVLAFLIAPVVAIATSLNAMNARETHPSA
jgi:hypothetical protein